MNNWKSFFGIFIVEIMTCLTINQIFKNFRDFPTVNIGMVNI